jgi:hypothetical protein
MAYRYDMLFQMTTAPTQASKAIAHTAGWSESHWRQDSLPQTDDKLQRLLNARAAMLPKQAGMVGLRIGQFTLQGNRLLPGQTSIRKFLKPGQQGYSCDVPQMALELGGSTSGINSSKFAVRGMPDNQVVNGEYSPTDAWDQRLQEYINALEAQGWQMVGRVLTNQTYRINSISISGGCTLGVAVPWANGAQIRLLRCNDLNGFPVNGVYQADQVAGSTFLLKNWPANVAVQDKGSARVDAIDFFTFVDIEVSRVVVRKVGRPFEQYRGRRSKRRARAA